MDKQKELGGEGHSTEAKNAQMYNGFKEELKKLDPKHFLEIMQSVNPEVINDVDDVHTMIDGLSQKQMEMVADKVAQFKDSTPADATKQNKMLGMNEDELKSIFGDLLSEDRTLEVQTLFESAVDQKVKSIAEEIENELNEEFEDTIEALVEQIDQYMNYVAEEFMEENRQALETSLKTEIAEEFIADLKTLFEDHNINIPEDQIDAVEEMAETIEELQESVNNLLQKNSYLVEQLQEQEKVELVIEAAKNLTLEQEDKFLSLVEGLDYTDHETYKRKLEIIRDKHFGNINEDEIVNPDYGLLNEDMNESDNIKKDLNEDLDPIIAATLNHIKRSSKK